DAIPATSLRILVRDSGGGHGHRDAFAPQDPPRFASARQALRWPWEDDPGIVAWARSWRQRGTSASRFPRRKHPGRTYAFALRRLAGGPPIDASFSSMAFVTKSITDGSALTQWSLSRRCLGTSPSLRLPPVGRTRLPTRRLLRK